MPRPRKNPVINNGPVDVPEPPKAANAANFPEAYDGGRVSKSVGVPIEQAAPSRPFGPGADYPSNSASVRYHDPSTGRTIAFTFTDATIDAIETFCDALDDRGYLPCAAPDAPRESVQRQPDPMDDDKAIGRAARKPRQRRFDDDDEDNSPVVNFGKYNGQTVREIYESGKRGQSYVEWLADNARQRNVRKAAEELVS